MIQDSDWNRAQPWNMPNAGFKSPKLRILDPLTLAGKPVPERRWIVPGWVPHGHSTMLSGDGGVGKSLLAMQLLTACATGQEWVGQPVMRCRTVGIFCEDEPEELHRRQAAINQALGINFGDLEDLKLVSRISEDNFIMVEGRDGKLEPEPFFQSIHNLATDFGAQLIVLDSLHDLFGANENNRVHARRFIQILTQLARDVDGAVVLTAHPSAAGLSSGSGTSGSTAWSNSVRSRLYLTRPKGDDGAEDRDARVLSRKKSNYAAVGDDLRLRWTDGAFISQDRIGGALGAIERRTAERVFLELLDATERSGRPASDSPNAGNYAPKMFASRPDRAGFDRRDFRLAMESLFASNEIAMVEYGRPGKWRRKLARKQATEKAS